MFHSQMSQSQQHRTHTGRQTQVLRTGRTTGQPPGQLPRPRRLTRTRLSQHNHATLLLLLTLLKHPLPCLACTVLLDNHVWLARLIPLQILPRLALRQPPRLVLLTLPRKPHQTQRHIRLINRQVHLK